MNGLAILLTGLPGAGKTTLSSALARRIESDYGRPVTLLDGDEIRKLLSSELGFSHEHRRLNMLRHAFIAAELCRHGAIAICALIAPYDEVRREMRAMIAPHGRFLEVYLSTPLTVCEQRDPKRLYARARAGELSHVTGIDDPYERPRAPDLELDTSALSVDQCVNRILSMLEPELRRDG